MSGFRVEGCELIDIAESLDLNASFLTLITEVYGCLCVQHLLDYFTYKGVKTVLAQLSEMNPPEYAWFYK